MSNPGDQEFTVGETPWNVTWTCNYSHGSPIEWRLFIDGDVETSSPSWTNSSSIEIDLFSYLSESGTYNVTIIFEVFYYGPFFGKNEIEVSVYVPKITIEQINSISVGDTIRIENARVSLFRGERQLRIGRNGLLEIIKDKNNN